MGASGGWQLQPHLIVYYKVTLKRIVSRRPKMRRDSEPDLASLLVIVRLQRTSQRPGRCGRLEVILVVAELVEVDIGLCEQTQVQLAGQTKLIHICFFLK